jgi:lipopolysaccharide export system permease protein
MISMPTQQPVQLSRVYYNENLLKVRDVANQFQETNADTAIKGEREMSICEMQKEYMIARAVLHRYEVERDSFKLMESQMPRASAAGTNMASPQLALPEESRDPAGARRRAAPKEKGGLGAYYCEMLKKLPALTKLVKAKDLHAAELPPPQAGGGSSRPLPPSAGFTVGSTSLADAEMRLHEAQRRQNRMGVEIQKKFSLAFACIVFVLVGAPIALRFPRGGVGLVIGVSFLVFAIYYVTLIGGEELANRSYLSPLWAMWGANIIFAAAGIILISRMGHESATSRGGGLASIVDATRLWFERRGRRSEP